MENKYTHGMKHLKEVFPRLAKQYNKPVCYFWLHALWCHLRYGVTPNQYISWEFYAKSHLQRKTFYTRRHLLHYEPKLNDAAYAHIFNNKQEFNEYFKEFIKRDWLYCADASVAEIETFLRTHFKVLVKPTALSSGRGIHLYSQETPQELQAQQCLLEEFIEQHPDMASLNPTSINSIRVYTLLTPQKQVCFLTTVVRVGGEGVTDNYHAGGVGYPIDPESGLIFKPGKNIMNEKFIFHPTTHQQMVGFQIPNWQALRAFVSRAALKVPTARLIAWDVAVLKDGFDMIEGNYCGGPQLMQVFRETGVLREIKEYL